MCLHMTVHATSYICNCLPNSNLRHHALQLYMYDHHYHIHIRAHIYLHIYTHVCIMRVYMTLACQVSANCILTDKPALIQMQTIAVGL